jgi:hypothetical protein
MAHTEQELEAIEEKLNTLLREFAEQQQSKVAETAATTGHVVNVEQREESSHDAWQAALDRADAVVGGQDESGTGRRKFSERSGLLA